MSVLVHFGSFWDSRPRDKTADLNSMGIERRIASISRGARKRLGRPPKQQ